MKIDAIIFDLDGTLWDTTHTCAVGWNAVCKRLDIRFREITADDVKRVMGKSHEECIRETFRGVSNDQLQTLIDLTMTEDNEMVKRFGGMLYDGVVAGLNDLSKTYRLCIVSNCQSGYIETFLEYAGVQPCFVDFECWGNTRRSKGENLASLIKRNSLEAPLMVGDTEGDRDAARYCGVPFVHVTYGFGGRLNGERSYDSFAALLAHFQIRE